MLAKRAEAMYYKEMFDRKSNTVKKLWTNLNEVCSFKAKRNKTNVTQLEFDHMLLVNNADTSNGFNSYFTNVSENIVNKFVRPRWPYDMRPSVCHCNSLGGAT